jgi:hypothetical protein
MKGRLVKTCPGCIFKLFFHYFGYDVVALYLGPLGMAWTDEPHIKMVKEWPHGFTVQSDDRVQGAFTVSMLSHSEFPKHRLIRKGDPTPLLHEH